MRYLCKPASLAEQKFTAPLHSENCVSHIDLCELPLLPVASRGAQRLCVSSFSLSSHLGSRPRTRPLPGFSSRAATRFTHKNASSSPVLQLRCTLETPNIVPLLATCRHLRLTIHAKTLSRIRDRALHRTSLRLAVISVSRGP